MEQRITLPERHLNELRSLLCQVRNEYAMYAESSDKKAELVAEKMDYIYLNAMARADFTPVQLRRYAKVIGNTSCAAFYALGDSSDDDESWVLQFIDNLKEFAVMAKDMPLQENK